ncbi:MAG: YlxR family protein [Peptococcaceae bacterium]|nr:YlxR family protein [Peptococcaceae bacterium]MBQ6888683.1 YlxR family protein [Lachnospiraceae bacterium]MBO5140138.1 YlxR family protein [Peptococcaceae bacterium]MBO5366010.1 YlxR family protein [Peptococcaceae bacterium]MBO5430260.1 YlxR family protein [Peptococcaceae bacterium]
MMPKKIPQRTCMACQEKKDKRDLVRIVRSPEGEISVDLTGKKPGRGAYICPNLECLNKVIKSKRLERSLETAISQEIYESLKEQLT